MGKKQRVDIRSKNSNEEIPFLWWLGAAGIALFMMIFPYDKAMFNGYDSSFEQIINAAAIYSYILMLISVVFLIRKWQFHHHAGILSIAVLLLPLVYWISSFGAVSHFYGDYMVLIYAMFAALFITTLYAAQSRLTGKLIEAGMMASSAIIVFIGLLNLFGQSYLRDALWLAHDGYRLTSVFQYSNTYAGYLVAVFFACLYYAVQGTRTLTRLAAAAMLAPVWISFMMTYSRGAIVVIPVILLVILPFLKLSRQITFILYTGVSVLVSMLVLSTISENSATIAKLVQPTAEKAPSPISLFSSLPLQNWGLLLLAVAVITGLFWLYELKCHSFVESKVRNLSQRKWSYLMLPAIAIALCALVGGLLLGSPAVRNLLPQHLADRIASINFQQHSVLERFTFYKDGLKLSGDYPLFGAGGGAWQSLYEQYQNNPYTSRQAHSFFVQVLVETGWIGLLTLLAFIAFIYYRYIRSFISNPEARGNHFVFFIMSFSLLLHSAIDFDMSYVYVGGLLFICFGGMMAPYAHTPASRKFESLSSKSWSRSMYPIVVSVLTIVMLFTVIQYNRSLSAYNHAIKSAAQNTLPFNKLIEEIDKAIDIVPEKTAYSVLKINWLMQGYEQNKDTSLLDAAFSALENVERYEQYDRNFFVNKLNLLNVNNEMEQSVPVIEDTLIKFPWDISFYERAFLIYDSLRETALAAQDTANAKALGDRIKEIHEEIQRRMKLLEELPEEQQQGRNFGITEHMQVVLTKLD
ncbi:O-antigen ligase family protein [Paenibacillus sp. strain BS8-2]